MDMQNVSNLIIPEGEVKAIHDSNSRLLWGRLNYDAKYAGDTFQQAYSGKNLLLIPDTKITNNVTLTKNSDGTFNVVSNGAATANTEFSIVIPLAEANLTGGEKYTISSNETIGTVDNSVRYYIHSCQSNGTWAKTLADMKNEGTYTLGEPSTQYIKFVIRVTNNTTVNLANVKTQIEAGQSATSYEPYVGGIASPNPDYPQAVNVVTGTQTITISDGTNSQSYTVGLGSTELCKIGTYQDYIYKSGDDWYVHKEVGKYTFNGSEGWATLPYGTNSWQLGNIISIYNYNMYDIYLACDFSQGAPYSARSSGDSTKTCICYTDTANKLFVRNTTLTTQAQMQTATTGKNIYYVATPIDTQITDSTLIGQLNAIHEWLTRYGYNVTVSGNLPIIIDRTNL